MMTQGNAFDEIIVALATPPGAAGVAVYRISGHDLGEVAQALSLPSPLTPRFATLCKLRQAETDTIIDHALVISFPAPHSFTGEDVIELHTHGGMAIQRLLLSTLTALPRCRMAQPGEFSRRAFMNNKMDLLQAEAIADLIASETTAQHALALRQLGGDMSERFSALRTDTLRTLALLEAYIDFPDEEIPESTLQDIEHTAANVRIQISQLLDEPPCGELIREGISIAIIGPPNAGKSSLMNRLANRDIAIVSGVAGTTRDRIETHLTIGGYLVKLIDTAGLRDTTDEIEQEGIRRAKQASQDAAITLVIADIVSDMECFELPYGLGADNALLLLNKCDQPHASPLTQNPLPNPLTISAKTGEGIDGLIARLDDMIAQKMAACPSPSITRARHRDALREASERMNEFNIRELPLELAGETLRQAARSVGKITGQIEVDQLLDVIFREFCIGK